jgi:protoporphyrinogen oxidase
MKNDYEAIVIGGGITGLIAAYELVKRGRSVALFEETGQLGGEIRPFKVNGYWIEGFYHHLFNQDNLIFNLAKELKLEITWHITKIAFYYSQEEIYAFSSFLDLFRFSKLSPKERIKLGQFLTKVFLTRNVDYLANHLARDWLISCVGEHIYTIFFEPMLRAKFGMYADEIGADWILGRLKMRSGHTWAGEKLGYIQGGFGCLIGRLAEEIENAGGKIYLNSKVCRIMTESGRAAGVSIKHGRRFYSNHILSTAPPESLLELIDFPNDYSKKIRELEYQGSICVIIAMEKELTEYYWINMMDSELKFNALIEHTNFQSTVNYGEHIIYLASYPDKNSTIWNLSGEKIIKEYLRSLNVAFQSFREEEVKWAKVIRSRNAGLIYRMGTKKKLPDIQTPIHNLFIGGMFNAYPKRSINTCAQIALKCTDKIALYEQ